MISILSCKKNKSETLEVIEKPKAASYFVAEGNEAVLRQIYEELDLRSFSSSFSQKVKTNPDKLTIAENLIKPRISYNDTKGELQIETDSWSYSLAMLERGDFNMDGIEDMKISFTDKSKIGTYNTSHDYYIGKSSAGEKIKVFTPEEKVIKEPIGELISVNKSIGEYATFNLYDGWNGNVIGTGCIYNQEKGGLVFGKDLATAKRTELTHPTDVKMNNKYLTVINYVDGWIQLQKDSGKYWVRQDQLKGIFKNATFLTKFVKGTPCKLVGYNNYRIRIRPDLTGSIVLKLKEDSHIIESYTGKTAGNWVEIIVREVSERTECCQEITEEAPTYQGWIRILTKEGKIGDIHERPDC